jgi:transcriptional regulator with XRE-family HTH domain
MNEETLGSRIRRLRMERGMSLAQVAGGDFSRAFLHQVETGKAQPSTRVLRVIATRLGSRVEFLLSGAPTRPELEIAVERARIELLYGHYQQALELLGPVLNTSEWPLGADARLAAAEALRTLGRREESDRLLDAEEAPVRKAGDRHRLRRLRAIRRGAHYRPSARDLLDMSAEAEREGRLQLAAELAREARVLLTGPAGRYRKEAGQDSAE